MNFFETVFRFSGIYLLYQPKQKEKKMVKNTKTVYEIIQNIPVESMIALSFTQLREFEAQLKEEVIAHTLKHREKTKEYHRAVLALRWVQGVIRIKSMDECQGVQHG